MQAYQDRPLAVMKITIKLCSLQVNICYKHRRSQQVHRNCRKQNDNKHRRSVKAPDSRTSQYFNMIYAKIAAIKADL